MILRSLTATLLAVMPLPALAQTVERHPSTPPGTILEAVTVKSGATTTYLSGLVPAPLDSAKDKPPATLTPADYGDTKAQTVSTLNRVKAALARRGLGMGDVIKLTVYLVGDPKLDGKMDFAGMNAGFRQFFGTADNPATVARSTVQVTALASPNFLVEIEATAAR
jgi:enamine deaminase RidA (YjgF/YER057c/UK114 family)